MTDDFNNVPSLLKGIHGVKWYRPAARRVAWRMLTETVLGGTIAEDVLENIKKEIYKLLDQQKELYLCDPPYDSATPEAGPPVSVYDPEPEPSTNEDPSLQPFDPESEQLVESLQPDSVLGPSYSSRRRKVRILHRIRSLIDTILSRN